MGVLAHLSVLDRSSPRREVKIDGTIRLFDSNRYERPTLTGLAWLEGGFSEFRCFERL